MPEERNIVFISHATPEDNDFTIWLASRLQLLGYEVWIDKNQLIGGEKFWEEIDLTIRNKAIKFLLVYSKNVCQKDSNNCPIPGKLKDGISKEFILADSISKSNKLSDFIILLNVDGSNYNLFIDAPRLNQISFNLDWSNGFNQLLKKLQKDNIPIKEELVDNNFGDWYQNKYLVVNNVEQRPELYHSNWWEINLPEYFYIYKLTNESQAKEIYIQNTTFPISRISNILSSFQYYSQFEIIYQGENIEIKPDEIFTIKINDVLFGFDSVKFPTLKDCENNLKYLLNRVFHLLMKSRRLNWYEMANKKIAYFNTLNNLPTMNVKFSYPYRSEKSKRKYKRKNLIGDFVSTGKWHYAVSSKTILSPLVAFSLKGHLTFTKDGNNLITDSKGEVDKEKIHSYRRKKGRRFFNEAWRDMLLGFLYKLQIDGKIKIALSDSFELEMSQYPVNFWSDFGYIDPRGEDRQGILIDEGFKDVESDDGEGIDA